MTTINVEALIVRLQNDAAELSGTPPSEDDFQRGYRVGQRDRAEVDAELLATLRQGTVSVGAYPASAIRDDPARVVAKIAEIDARARSADIDAIIVEMEGLLGPSVRSEASLFQTYIKQWSRRLRALNAPKKPATPGPDLPPWPFTPA